MKLTLLTLGLLALAPQDPRRKDPFEILPAPSDAAPLATKLGDQESSLTVEGDVLTVLYKGAGDKVQMTGGIQKPMNKIGDLWVLQLKMPGWDKAFISYSFYDPAQLKPGDRLKTNQWRGAAAPPKPEEATTLKGQIIRRTFKSKAMDQERPLTIYLPPNAPKSGLPAFFMADGGGCEGIAKVLEPLILAGKVKPVAIIGVNSGENYNKPGEHDMEKDHRATEYLQGQSRYAMHMKFFGDEVPAWATKEFGISSKREDRCVFGFSNGGSFSAGACVERPNVFGYAIPMSVGAPPDNPKPDKPMPRMFLVAGKLEPAFAMHTTDFYEKVKGWGADASLHLYVAGHDWEMWRLAVTEFAPQIFPAK